MAQYDGDIQQILRDILNDQRKTSESLVRLTEAFEQWTPTWRAQGDGLVDVTNRQTKIEGRLDNLCKEFETDKKYRESLEKIASLAADERASARKEAADLAKSTAEELAKARKEDKDRADKLDQDRAKTRREVIGLSIGIISLLIGILTFLYQHVNLK